jgi:hypothetical protein
VDRKSGEEGGEDKIRAFDRKVRNQEARVVASLLPFIPPHRLTAEDFGKRTELYRGHKRCLARKFSRTSIELIDDEVTNVSLSLLLSLICKRDVTPV